jgi:hypothetical protein
MTAALTSPHQVTRLSFDTAQPYEQFRARYEDAVPEPYGVGPVRGMG